MRTYRFSFPMHGVRDYRVEDGNLIVDVEVQNRDFDTREVFSAIENLPVGVKDRRTLIEALEDGMDEITIRSMFATGVIRQTRVE